MSYLIANNIKDQFDSEHFAALKHYRENWNAYEGNFPNSLKVKSGAPNDNIKANYAKLIVDKSVSYLFKKFPAIEEVDREGIDLDERTDNELFLSSVLDANGGPGTWLKVATNGGVCGTAFVKLIPHPTKIARIINLDPAIVRPYWRHEDIEEVYKYVISYSAVDDKNRTIRVEEIHEISEDRTYWDITTRTILIQNEAVLTSFTETWNYPWSQIHYCQNYIAPNVFFGLSDLEDDVLVLNRALNFVLTNINRILRFYAHPKTWGRGIDSTKIAVGIDDIILLQNETGTLQNLEMQSDLASSIEFYKRIKEALHQISKTPEVSTGKMDNVGQLSGLALSIMYEPLIEKTEIKRMTYGPLLLDICAHIFEIGGREVPKMKLQWPEILPRDPLQERQTYMIDNTLGASQFTILEKLGYNPVLENKRKTAETEAQQNLQAQVQPMGGNNMRSPASSQAADNKLKG